MTCIVGFLDRNSGDVYIGGDSADISNYDISIREDEKVFRKNDMIFGFTCSFRLGQILRYCLSIPPQNKSEDDFQYLCNTFISSLINCLDTFKYDYKKSGVGFLLGFNGKLYHVQNDFQVAKIMSDFDATGCGADYCLGAMQVLNQNEKMHPKDKIFESLKVASKFSAGVAEPFKIVQLKSNNNVVKKSKIKVTIIK